MAPLDTEVGRSEKFGRALFARLVVRVVDGEVSARLVIDFVSGVYIDAPGTERVNVSGYGKVEIVAEYEIHTGVPEVESARLLFSERWHQQTGGPFRTFRNKTERKSDKRQVHVFQY